MHSFAKDFGMVAYYADYFANMFAAIVRQRQKSVYTVFDVGFNTGQFTRLALAVFEQYKSVGIVSADAKIRIVAFEPNIHLARVAQKIENLEVHSLALADKSGSCTLHIPLLHDEPDDLEQGSITYRNEYGGVYGISTLGIERCDDINRNFPSVRWQSLNVTTDTIDNFCLNNAIDEIDWIKIDVEAFEKNVILGAATMLNAGKIAGGQFEGDTTFNAPTKISTALGNNSETQKFIDECCITLFDANYMPVKLPTSNRLIENEFFFIARNQR